MELVFKSLAVASVCLNFCFLSGCGGPNEATVNGTVTLDDVAVGPGLVTFHPQAGGVTSYSQFDAAGHYALKSGASKGLNAGEYLVTVSTYGPDSEVEHRNAKSKTLELTKTPEIYGAPESSPLKVEVKLGRNTIPLQLKSDATASE